MTPTTASRDVAATLSPIDRSAIATYLIRMEQLERANDWPNLSLMVTEDCITMPPRHTTREGRLSWLQWIQESGFRVHDFSLVPQEYEGCGDLAFVRCDYDWAYTLEEHNEPIRDSGRFMAILRKQSNHEWLATHWIWNSDTRRT